MHITLIDRNNHHVFQPLLYQVATSVLTPGQIGAPIRGILARKQNVTVFLGEVTGMDKERRCVLVNSIDRENVPIDYDYLILATGVGHSYFGHDEFAQFAPGIKGIGGCCRDPKQDPSGVRASGGRGGSSQTSRAADVRVGRCGTYWRGDGRRDRRSGAKHFVVAISTHRPDFGANRTGGHGTFRSQHICGAPCPPKATRRLETLGVEVRLGHGVDKIDAEASIAAGERIASKTVIWTAGVAPSPAGKWLGVADRPGGRVRVQDDLLGSQSPEIFVIGDTASLDRDGKPLPGVAQVAIQQGRYVGKLIHRRSLTGKSAPPPFRYFDKGNMAVVGKGFAVVQTGPIKFSGFFCMVGMGVRSHSIPGPGQHCA